MKSYSAESLRRPRRLRLRRRGGRLPTTAAAVAAPRRPLTTAAGPAEARGRADPARVAAAAGRRGTGGWPPGSRRYYRLPIARRQRTGGRGAAEAGGRRR